ncbi:MAG: glycosyltransferase family 4 protein [Proteobacteria bacterium]|nr:glycosyltransferase family 4 protein [Pseudomonadota bacterium]
MRIAQVAPLYESVPPQGYGGTERVVSYLTETLVALGHDVTLYASGDSRTAARHVSVLERSLRLDERRRDPMVWHAMMLDRLWDEAGRYDVIHFHTDAIHLALARRCPAASLTTLHGRLDLPDLAPLYHHFAGLPLVSISNDQRRPMPWASWCATIPHGLPERLYTPRYEPGAYFAFLGRISPEKRLDRAIEIAIACDVPLMVAAKVDPADRDYYEREIRPLMSDPHVRYIGEIGDRDKGEFLGRARALLMPIDWPEPFGLVMIEALACGTPVLAYAHGSVPEIIDDGVTGYAVHDQAEAIAAARRIGALSRPACRAAFDRCYTARTMAEGHLDVYRRLIARRAVSPAQGAVHAATDPDRR